jgi:hypothetical protein
MNIQIFDGIEDGEIVTRDATPEEAAALIAAIQATSPAPTRNDLLAELGAARKAREAANVEHEAALAEWNDQGRGTATERMLASLSERTAASERVAAAASAIRAFDRGVGA